MRHSLAASLLLLLAFPTTAPIQDVLSTVMRQIDDALEERPLDYHKIVFYIGQLGEIGTEEAAEVALKTIERTRFNSQVSAAVTKAIRAMDPEVSERFVLREVEGDMDYRLRLPLVDVLAGMKSQEAFDTLILLLDERKELMQAAALQGLRGRGDKRAIGPVIELMKKHDKKKDHVWQWCQATLTKLTGQSLELGVDFEVWWQAHGGQKVDPETGDGGGPGGRGDRPVEGRVERIQGRDVTFFGLRITCSKIVFIIDVSGSMKTRDPYPPNARTRAPGEEVPEPGPDRIRLVRAQKELNDVIDKLDKGVQFNIIAYSDILDQWSRKGLKTATKGNKSSAKKFVKKFKAKGTTHTDEALQEAYTVNTEAHCFYLLSDGSPTHEGGEIPMDTLAIIEQIYAMIPELDVYRRVRIHTLGFQGANVGFMQKLADMSGGEYLDIR